MSRLKVSTRGRSTSYVCEDMDAGLALHAHQPGSGMEHDIRCTAGRILVFVHPGDVHELANGDTLEFDATRWHGIKPLQVGAAFVNTSSMEQPDFDSVLDSPHNAPTWACL
jgi:hypothetical protein